MPSIQHSFSYENLSAGSDLENVHIIVLFPKFSFRFLEDGSVRRFVSDQTSYTISHNPNDEKYRVKLPLSKIVGTDTKDIYGFFLYHFIEILNPEKDINDFSFPFTVLIKDNKGNEILSETFEGVFYRKKSHSSDYDRRDYQKEKGDFETKYGPLEELNIKGLKQLPRANDKQVYLFGKESYEALKYLVNRAPRDNFFMTDQNILEFIEILTDMDGPAPKLISREEAIGLTELLDFFTKRQITLTSTEASSYLDNVKPYIDPLFDFPISLSELEMIEIKGNLLIESASELELSDLDFYDLSVEYSQKNSSPIILRYNWNQDENEPVDNKIEFSFTKDQPIIANNISGRIVVVLKGYDGAVLWSKSYNTTDEELKKIQIKINAYPENKISIDSNTGQPKSTKRLRGKVLQHGNKHDLNDLTIVIQARSEQDENFTVVSAGQTDQSGNFSLDYPYGNYKEAQALVSLMPDNPANVAIVNKPNQAISDDFLYLLISDDAVLPTDDTNIKDDNCECDTTNKAKRLPDQADLIGSDEYTQDIGGSCINLSTPNRTLSEYSYNAIVRVSDPDVANYVLEKKEVGEKVQYELERKGEKLQRGEIDIDNPIRWEDAPDAKSDLSLYQAVTVATGHILHFKSVFKADGYSLGDLVYSLPLAPGQKKQIVVFESSHSLQGSETQSLSQGESLEAGLVSERAITDQLSGGINESISGRSKARTSGMSAGLGAAGSYGGIGASLGIAGGFSKSSSSASQNGSRNVSQFFGEKLRQSLMQNAASYRELNASVVTTVTEGQDYGVTSETIANHNHCHSLTMMYFEVMRHFAIYQEISHVEECVFVPLLLTHFTTENIHKWKDILAVNLLPIPSNTYLGNFQFFFGKKAHPLLKAFDANERVKTKWERVEFPGRNETFADGIINQIKGNMTININIPRPKTQYDRIKSLPIVSRVVVHKEFDPVATAKSFLGPPWKWGKKYKTTKERIEERAEIFDQFMQLDANFQSVPAAQCIRIVNFQPIDFNITINDVEESKKISGEDFFAGGHIDRLLWETYASILGYTGDNAVYNMLDYYFKGRLIAEWDEIFYNDMLPLIFARIADSIKLYKGKVEVIEIDDPTQPERQYELEYSSNGPELDFSTNSKYTGGNKSIRVNFSGDYSGTRKKLSEAGNYLSVICDNDDLFKIKNHIKLNLGSVNMDYTTDFFQGKLFRGYVNDDLLDGTNLYIPLTSRDKVNPTKEDEYLVNALIEHLNSNLEHYNKVLWTNLDPDRRYMLLDGFSIQTYTSSGLKIPAKRSLASVVKNELITIAGNSLVFPVADGYKVGRDSMIEEAGDGETVETALIDYYKPLTPMPPYRLSVPTRGVYMEAIMGKCDACEMVKENSSQDWDKFRTEETTAIQPIITPTPTITDYKPEYKDFAQPLVNIQNAPDAPAPAAGLAGLNEILGKSDAFRDVTGLAANQSNAIETFKANTQAAQEYAKMATSLANQQHNTQNSQGIRESIEQARTDGTISEDDARALTRQHLQQQIDGGERDRDAAQFEREQNRTSLSDLAAEAINRGQSVQAERTDTDGLQESIRLVNSGPVINQPCGYYGDGDAITHAALISKIQQISMEENNKWFEFGGLGEVTGFRTESDDSAFKYLVVYSLSFHFRGPDTTPNLFERIRQEILAYPNLTKASDVGNVKNDINTSVGGTNTTRTLIGRALAQAVSASNGNFPWSAVFITYCVRQAALDLGIEYLNGNTTLNTGKLLRLSTAHGQYSREAYNKKIDNINGSYHAFPVNDVEIEVGDIIVQDRRKHDPGQDCHFANFGFTSVRSYAGLENNNYGCTHGDIVIDIDNGSAITVGGNLSQGVRRRRYPLTEGNHLDIDNAEQRIYTQESDTGNLGETSHSPAGANIQGRSTSRVFTVLKLIEECGINSPISYGGGILV